MISNVIASKETTTSNISAVPMYPTTFWVRKATNATIKTSKKLLLYCILSDGFSLNIFFNAGVLV
jgi:hypothetical protein